MTLAARLALAAVSGFLLFCSYEPLGWWWAAIIGLALLFVALSPWRSSQVTAKMGGLLGFVHALANYLFLLPWIGEFVGKLPYIALSITEALYSIAFGACAALIIRYTKLKPLWFASWYLAVEYVRSSWPFNGFAWVRLAWGQIDGPVATLTQFGGPALVSFVAALLSAGIATPILFFMDNRYAERKTVVRQSVWAVVAIVAILAGVVTQPRSADVGEVRVAAVQGNVPRMGLDFNAQRRAVLANHVRQTEALPGQVDVVIWPENSSDVNPFADAQAAQLIQQAVKSAQAPILVGTLTRDEVGDRNTMVVFNADGSTGDMHMKKYLQPFGEYMPFRSFFRQFSSYVDMAGDFKAGTGTGLVHMRAARSGEEVKIGVATCYEVAFDRAYRDSIKEGAQILATPTNNATFGFTDMTYQQLAMSRMRAKELDRAVVIAATSGVSALVMPDGSVIKQSKIFTADSLVADLPLRDTVTPAARFGTTIELLLVGLGIVGAGLGVWRARLATPERRRQANRKSARAQRGGKKSR